MFERFTERARQVTVLAQEEARSHGHSRIGTEHLLLGLLREKDGLAGRVLTSVGVTYEQVSEKLDAIFDRGQVPITGQIPFTANAKRMMEWALREALSLGHNYIGTEHLLLALMREGGAGAFLLERMGGDRERIKREITRNLSSLQPEKEQKIDPEVVDSLRQAEAALMLALQLVQKQLPPW